MIVKVTSSPIIASISTPTSVTSNGTSSDTTRSSGTAIGASSLRCLAANGIWNSNKPRFELSCPSLAVKVMTSRSNGLLLVIQVNTPSTGPETRPPKTASASPVLSSQVENRILWISPSSTSFMSIVKVNPSATSKYSTWLVTVGASLIGRTFIVTVASGESSRPTSLA